MGRHGAGRMVTAVDRRFPARTPVHSDLFVPERDDEADAEFAELVDPHYAALSAYVLQLTKGDSDLADSVVEKTLHWAALEPSRYPQRASAVGPWLMRIAFAVLRDGALLSQPGTTAAPHGAGRDERFAATVGASTTTVVRALEHLSSMYRDILVELFYDGVSMEDFATAHGMTVETVTSRLYYAMRALRAVLEEHIADRHVAVARL